MIVASELRSVAASVAIAVSFSLTVKLEADVIVGGVVSTTLTVLVTAVAALPEASDALYVSVYVPTVSASTVPVVVTVISPDKSLAVAPASVYVEPNSTVTGLSPVTVITGAVVSTTLTVLDAVVAALPESLDA